MKKLSLCKLSVVNAKYYAYHGVLAEEKKIGGKYEVDIDMYYNSSDAALKDDVQHAINYEDALFLVDEIMGDESYDLIETVASEILNALMDKFDALQEATVRVRKLNAPLKAVVDYVEAEQTIVRNKGEK
jgi:7,8-dihydroneopterin aldolase/epimerase/oxygenase